MADSISNNRYSTLRQQIGSLLQQGRLQAGRAVNTILLQTYWHIGRHIVEYEQGGSDTAVYGTALLDTLSRDLTQEYGRGFSRSNRSS